MGDFNKKSFRSKDVNPNDQGVRVRSVVELIEASIYYADLTELLKIDSIIDDFIEIPGAHTLVAKIKIENDKYAKYDVTSNYNSLQFIKGENDTFLFKFTEVENEKLVEHIGNDSFVAEPIYSSKSDFFESTFGMDKYASSLTKGVVT